MGGSQDMLRPDQGPAAILRVEIISDRRVHERNLERPFVRWCDAAADDFRRGSHGRLGMTAEKPLHHRVLALLHISAHPAGGLIGDGGCRSRRGD